MRFSFLFLSLFSFAVMAIEPQPPTSRVVDAAVTTIPHTYSNAAGSLVFVVPAGASHIKVQNTTSCGVALNGFYQSALPANDDTHNVYSIEPTKVVGFTNDDMYVGGNLYLRSNCDVPTAQTSGKVTIEVW